MSLNAQKEENQEPSDKLNQMNASVTLRESEVLYENQ